MFNRNSSDALNPVFYKLMRQALNSRFLVVLVLGVALAEVMVALGCWASWRESITYGGTPNYQGWLMLFQIAYIVAIVSCGFFVTTTVWCRELGVEGLDVRCGTRLKPATIVKGLLYALLAISALPTLVAAPILGFAVNHTRIAALLFPLVAGLSISCVAMACSCLELEFSNNKGKFSLSGVVFVVATLITMGISGYYFDSNRPNYEIITSVPVRSYLLAAVVAVVASVGLLRHPSQNRVAPFRIAILIAVALWIALGCLQMTNVTTQTFCALAGYTCCFCADMMTFLGSCERLKPSRRISMALPKNWLGKIAVLPFLPGAAMGISFGWCMAAIGTLALVLSDGLTAYCNSSSKLSVVTFAVYLLLYAECISFMRRTFHFSITQSYAIVAACSLILLPVAIYTNNPFLAILNPFFTAIASNEVILYTQIAALVIAFALARWNHSKYLKLLFNQLQ